MTKQKGSRGPWIVVALVVLAASPVAWVLAAGGTGRWSAWVAAAVAFFVAAGVFLRSLPSR